jgi:hypothetical protein
MDNNAPFALSNLLSQQNVLIVVAAWFTLEILKTLFKSFWAGPIGQKLIVVMSVPICQIAVWTTVAWQPTATYGERVVLGLVLAAVTAKGHTIFKRFGLLKYLPVLGVKLKENGTPRDE